MLRKLPDRISLFQVHPAGRSGGIEELLNLDMEPKPESSWLTSAHEEEDKRTLKVGEGGKVWDLPIPLAELCAEKVWNTKAWAVCNGEVTVLKALRFVTTRSAWGMKWEPFNFTCWITSGDSMTEVSLGIHLWPDGPVRGRLDTAVENATSQEDRMFSCTCTGKTFVIVTDQKERWRHSSQEKKRKLDLLLLVLPRTVAGELVRKKVGLD